MTSVGAGTVDVAVAVAVGGNGVSVGNKVGGRGDGVTGAMVGGSRGRKGVGVGRTPHSEPAPAGLAQEVARARTRIARKTRIGWGARTVMACEQKDSDSVAAADLIFGDIAIPGGDCNPVSGQCAVVFEPTARGNPAIQVERKSAVGGNPLAMIAAGQMQV